MFFVHLSMICLVLNLKPFSLQALINQYMNVQTLKHKTRCCKGKSCILKMHWKYILTALFPPIVFNTNVFSWWCIFLFYILLVDSKYCSKRQNIATWKHSTNCLQVFTNCQKDRFTKASFNSKNRFSFYFILHFFLLTK